MRYLPHFVILFFFLASCSNQNTQFTVVCDASKAGSGFHDMSLTFDLKSNKVSSKEILNAFGHESKKKILDMTQRESAIEQFGEDTLNEFVEMFDEKEMSYVIRNIDEGFITFAVSEEKNISLDVEYTLDRANLNLKEVLYNAFAVDYGKDTETIRFYDCKIPSV